MKLLKNGCIVLFAVLSMQGCATMELKPTTVTWNGADSGNVKIMKSDYEGNPISIEEINAAIMDRLKVGYYGDYYTCKSGDCGIRRVRGVAMRVVNDKIDLAYYNGEYFVDTKNKYTSDILAELAFSVTEDGKYYNINITSPKTLEMIPRRTVLAINAEDYYATDDMVQKDIRTKIKNIETLSIKRNFVLKGEINSNYNSESIYANFKRLLGEYKFGKDVKITDIEKNNYFNYNFKGEKQPLKIAVYPYRNGSKAVYELTIPYIVSNEYSLNSQELKLAHKEIEKVVND